MRKIFPVCCASADAQSAKSMAQRVKNEIFFFCLCRPDARRTVT